MDWLRLLFYVVAIKLGVWVLKSLVLRGRKKPVPQPANIDEAKVAALLNKWKTAVKGLGTTGKRYVVIGTGFLGSRILSALVLRGESQIVAFDLVFSDDLRRQFPQVKFVQGNVGNIQAVREAVHGADVVYSTFAVIRYWEKLPHQLPASLINVEGTHAVVEACVAENVPMLISTSTSNVSVTNSLEPQYFDESTPYVNMDNAPHHYAYTKAQAERLVLQANAKPLAGGGAFRTGVVRPCSGIFGARDRLLLQRFLMRGQYEVIAINRINWVYVDNVVWAHLLMENALAKSPEKVAGKPVCVSNNYEATTLEFFNLLVAIKPSLHFVFLPRAVMFALASFLDFFRGILKHRMPSMGELDQVSRCCFEACSSTYLLKSDFAKHALGYEPLFTAPEAVLLTAAEFEREQAKPKAS